MCKYHYGYCHFRQKVMMQLFGLPIDSQKYNASTYITEGLLGRQFILPAIYCCTAPAPCLGNKEWENVVSTYIKMFYCQIWPRISLRCTDRFWWVFLQYSLLHSTFKLYVLDINILSVDI